MLRKGRIKLLLINRNLALQMTNISHIVQKHDMGISGDPTFPYQWTETKTTSIFVFSSNYQDDSKELMIVHFVGCTWYLGVDVIPHFEINKTLQLRVGPFTWRTRLPIDYTFYERGEEVQTLFNEVKVVGKCL